MSELPAPDYVEAGVLGLSVLFAVYRPGENPFHNMGAEWLGQRIHVRSFCWCDGNRHPDGCPPNLEWDGSDLTVCWYKYAGRGMTVSRPVDLMEWRSLMNLAIADIVC